MDIVAVVAKCLMVDTRLPEALITESSVEKPRQKGGLLNCVNFQR